VQYFHENASFATAVGMKPSPVVELSGTVGAHGLAFGAEAGYDTATGKLTKYSAGIGVTKPEYHSAFIL
jgi:voltage-dependent anion channel protein 2